LIQDLITQGPLGLFTKTLSGSLKLWVPLPKLAKEIPLQNLVEDLHLASFPFQDKRFYGLKVP
jgi:hypothetical protein